MSTFGHTQLEDIWAIHPTLSLDIPHHKAPLSTAESFYHTSPPCSSPPSPFTESSPSSSDTEDTEESDDAQHSDDSDSISSIEQDAAQQADLWCIALAEKKLAMETMLKAQKSLERVHKVLAQHVAVEAIERAHARLLGTISPTNPEAHYLLTIGGLTVNETLCPLSKCPS